MRKVTAVVVVPALMLSLSAAWATEVMTIDGVHHDNAAPRIMTHIPQSHMFDGIKLSEEQRRQMRDLMQQARHDRSPISINDYEQLHELIVADKFDEAAYKAQLNRITQAEMAQQVEMARVRNQMYHLLTPAQQDVLKQNHRQRMNEMRELTNMQQASSLQAVSSTGSNQ
ncbi:cell-envelope stress modulator CpxP [Erwinia sp. P6884]|uniref:cell-envelope stress modulator CpxP n=1 Tax=Erwinia sp. P6884 TaxID=3141450 RepID=UPI003196B314